METAAVATEKEDQKAKTRENLTLKSWGEPCTGTGTPQTLKCVRSEEADADADEEEEEEEENVSGDDMYISFLCLCLCLCLFYFVFCSPSTAPFINLHCYFFLSVKVSLAS